ncbi:MAG: MFS transporter [Chiayiivirga sp.]|jgi:hypothetical protein|nr:MFS transporter [Chiayiivirga sp.]MCI1728373.1 MFS transporter [Chiayiivirga sp.]
MNAVAALPRPTPAYRWIALVLASLAMFGNYYAYDALNPVVDLLRAQEGLDYGQVGRLSTAYNIAALLVLLAGGYVIDRFGARRAIVAFALVCVLAAAVTASAQDYSSLLAGRFLLGLGAEPLIVAVTAGAGEVVQGQGAEFRLRFESVDLASGLGLDRLVDLVRESVVLELARSAVAGDRRDVRGLRRRGAVLPDGETRRWAIRSRSGRCDGQARPQAALPLQSFVLVHRGLVRGVLFHRVSVSRLRDRLFPAGTRAVA